MQRTALSDTCPQCDQTFELEATEVMENYRADTTKRVLSYPSHENPDGRTCLGSLIAVDPDDFLPNPETLK